MATQKISPFDSVLGPIEVVRSLLEEDGIETGDKVATAPATTPSAADLALDLVLNEIVQQARLTTSATGAVIALLDGRKIVCRAASGATAPDVSAYLNFPSGISDTCVRFGLVQRCDDTESDSRVAAATCRNLGVRSLLMVPIQGKAENLGVIEVFSATSQAFSERDVLPLQALARRIEDNMERSKRVMAAAPLAVSVVPEKIISSAPPFRLPDLKLSLPRVELSVPRPRIKFPAVQLNLSPAFAFAKAWIRNGMFVLPAAVLTLALVLGWMLGLGAANPPAPVIQKPSPNRVSTARPARTQPAQDDETIVLDFGERARHSNAVKHVAKVERVPNSAPTDGLVVYENGKMIFRAESSQQPAPGQPFVANAVPAPATAAPEKTFTAPPVPATAAPEKTLTVPPAPVVEKREVITVPRSVAQPTRENAASAPPTVPVVSKQLSVPMQSTTGSVAALAPSAAPAVYVSEETANSNVVLRIEPDYPEQAKKEHRESVIYLAVIVSKTGAVQKVSVLSGDRQLAQAAADAVQQWRFKPLLRDGQAVRFETRIEVPFTLE